MQHNLQMNSPFVINALPQDRSEYIKVYLAIFLKIHFCLMKSYNLIKARRLICTSDKIP